MSDKPLRAALYARVSTLDHTTAIRSSSCGRYAEARGWSVTEYLDEGISGTKPRRPSLDRLQTDARRHRFDVLVVWRLDRLGRDLKHLIMTLDELTASASRLQRLNEGIDTTTPAGRLQLHLLGAIAEFERARIVERVRAGIARAKAQGKHLGRPRRTPAPVAVAGITVRQAVEQWNVSKTTAARWIAEGKIPTGQTPASAARLSPCVSGPEHLLFRGTRS